MKKNLLILLMAGLPSLAPAQQSDERVQEIFRQDYLRELPAMAFLVFLVYAILTLTRLLLDHRLKQKLINKGVSDTIIESFLKPTAFDAKRQAIKWVIILGSLSVGLLIVNYTLPLGFHSLSIMTGCLTAGFLAYYIYLRQSA